MNKLLPLFPLNASIKKNNLVSLIITIVLYVVIAAVLGVVIGFVHKIPVVGLLTGIVSTLIWIYEVVGIVLAIYTFIK